MRTATLALLAGFTLGVIAPAQAADLDYAELRGPDYEPDVPVIDWNGLYFGGHAGYTATDFNFQKSGQTELAQILRRTAIESEYNISKSNTLRPGVGHGLSYGGFAGYNYEFDEVIIGAEIDYTSLNHKARSEDSIQRYVMLSNGERTEYDVKTRAQSTLQDYATFRVRGGATLGSFLPYLTGGVALGRANTGSVVDATVVGYSNDTRTNVVSYLNRSGGSIKEVYALGAVVGAGLDYAVTQNIFLRAEYQHIWFDRFGDEKIKLNTFRGGLGMKF